MILFTPHIYSASYGPEQEADRAFMLGRGGPCDSTRSLGAHHSWTIGQNAVWTAVLR